MNSLDLNLHKYDRIFTFGCSFTHYSWATWSDIIRKEVGDDKVFNYGKGGAGNFFIINSIIEADHFYKFTENDLVMVKFTNSQREDRIVDNRWMSPGNIYSQGMFDDGFLKYWDDIHGMYRDISMIKMIKGFLTNRKIDHHFMSMVPLFSDLGGNKQIYPLELTAYAEECFEWIKPSIFELIFNESWHSIQPRSITFNLNATHPIFGKGWYEDNHAHPKEHLLYLQKLWPETKFSDETLEQVEIWHQMVLDCKVYQQRLVKDYPVPRLISI